MAAKQLAKNRNWINLFYMNVQDAIITHTSYYSIFLIKKALQVNYKYMKIRYY